jgi:hypothetical protein
VSLPANAFASTACVSASALLWRHRNLTLNGISTGNEHLPFPVPDALFNRCVGFGLVRADHRVSVFPSGKVLAGTLEFFFEPF